MTVYEVRMDVNNYQYLLASDPRRAVGRDLRFHCDRRAETWDPPEVYVSNPKAKRGSFLSLAAYDPLVCDLRAYEELGHIFETCAELLPLPVEDEKLYLINVLKCLDVLDVNRSTWRTKQPEGLPRKYVFSPERMEKAPLFKIPQTAVAQVLTVEGFLDEKYDFKRCVERAGLKGLIFHPLWSDDQP